MADAIEGKMEPTTVKKFALDRESSVHTLSRSDEPARELGLSELCGPEDLLP